MADQGFPVGGQYEEILAWGHMPAACLDPPMPKQIQGAWRVSHWGDEQHACSCEQAGCAQGYVQGGPKHLIFGHNLRICSHEQEAFVRLKKN